jgi:hypothetical protein
MASRSTLKNVAISRIKGAKLLLNGDDWEGSAHTMALALECALKAAVCKTLRIEDYPENHRDKKVPDFFMTHSFDRLLLLSGLSDVFSTQGNQQAFDNWSQFTIQFPGEWTGMKYDPQAAPNVFDRSLSARLMVQIYEDNQSIIKTIRRLKRW